MFLLLVAAAGAFTLPASSHRLLRPTRSIHCSEAAGQSIDLSGDGGVLKETLRLGSGPQPERGSRVEVHYEGRLADGTLFDSSRRSGGKSFKFDLGFRQVIAGWDIALAAMQVGEMAKLTLAPQYGYGQEGDPPKIPQSATLTFEVELLSMIEPQEEVEARDPNAIDFDDLMLMADLDDDDW